MTLGGPPPGTHVPRWMTTRLRLPHPTFSLFGTSTNSLPPSGASCQAWCRLYLPCPRHSEALVLQHLGGRQCEREKEKKSVLNTLLLLKQLTKPLSTFCHPEPLFLVGGWGSSKLRWVVWPCVYTELSLQPMIVFQGVVPGWKEITSTVNPNSLDPLKSSETGISSPDFNL